MAWHRVRWTLVITAVVAELVLFVGWRMARARTRQGDGART
jgi:hypothetical protein